MVWWDPSRIASKKWLRHSCTVAGPRVYFSVVMLFVHAMMFTWNSCAQACLLAQFTALCPVLPIRRAKQIFQSGIYKIPLVAALILVRDHVKRIRTSL